MEDAKQRLKWLDWAFTLVLGTGLIITGIFFISSHSLLWACITLAIGASLLALCAENLLDYLKLRRGQK